MPICFQLFKKGRPEDGPVKFTEVDEELCRHFGRPVDPKLYLAGWYDSIGWRLALGKTFDQVIECFEAQAAEFPADKEIYDGLIDIARYLAEHYQTESWWEAKV